MSRCGFAAEIRFDIVYTPSHDARDEPPGCPEINFAESAAWIDDVRVPLTSGLFAALGDRVQWRLIKSAIDHQQERETTERAVRRREEMQA